MVAPIVAYDVILKPNPKRLAHLLVLCGAGRFTRAFNFFSFSNTIWHETRLLGCDFTNIGMCEIFSSGFLLSFNVWLLTVPSAFYFLYPFIKRSFLWIKFISCTGGGGSRYREHAYTQHKHTHSCQKPSSSTLRDRNTNAGQCWLSSRREQSSTK